MVLGIALLVGSSRELAHAPTPPTVDPVPPPPPPCGVWPYDNPCGGCVFGVQKTLSVGTSDTCASLAQSLDVPQFDLFNRNRSASCCQQSNISVGDRIDVCLAPSREQWRKAGYPRRPPERDVVLSFLGAQPKGYSPPSQLPSSVNVVALYPVDDRGSTSGDFKVANTFSGVCSTGLNPSFEGRTTGSDSDVSRLWLFSLNTDAGNWDSHISPEKWGLNAAKSLENVILRYRLDGIDVNIEASRSRFGLMICSMFRHLRARMGMDLTLTLTPWRATMQYYTEVARTCLVNISWANYQTYSDGGFNPSSGKPPSSLSNAANVFGWHKVTWGISTQIGQSRPPVGSGLLLQQTLQNTHPEVRGVFVWTAEYSARCHPKWCFENLMMATMKGRSVANGACKC